MRDTTHPQGGKGELVVHVLADWSELGNTLYGWGRVAVMVFTFWLFLPNPTLAIMLFFGINAMWNNLMD